MEEEVGCIIEATQIVEGEGAVDSARVKAKRHGFFVEVLNERQKFMELDWSSLDKVECRYILVK